MNILIFSTFHLPPQFVGINLEFIQKNINAGHSVTLVDCDSTFSECGFNPYGLKYMCEICKFREKKGLKLLEGDYDKISLASIIKQGDKTKAFQFTNESKIISKDQKYKDFEVGEAVHSSFISKTRKREFVLDAEQNVLKRLTENSIMIYESLKSLIEEKKIDKLLLFNGRWDYYRAALAAGRSKNVDVEVFENYRSGGFLELFGNHLPHDILNKNKLIEEHWDQNQDQNKKLEIANDFFVEKRKGAAISDKAYTKNQKKGKLPQGYDSSKKTFVLYNSSDDEFASVGRQFENPFFKDQLEGILYLTDYFKEKNNFQLIIRMHPNLKGLKRDYLDPIYALENEFQNIILIKPQDDADTYELMNVANTVISFGSTAGLEAAYWGKPVILLGKSFYYYTGVAYVPESKKEITKLIEEDLAPLDRISAQKFGYYIMSGGVKANYFYSDPEKNYYFKEQPLNKLPGWFKVKYKALKLLKIKNKKDSSTMK